MENKKYILVIKHTTYVMILFVLYILQTTPGLFSIFGIKPTLLIPAAVCIAIFEDEFLGGIYGASAGLLCDVGGFVLFGFNAVILMITGVVIGLLVIYLAKQRLINCILFVFSVSLIQNFLIFFFYYLMWGYQESYRIFVYSFLPGIVYTTLITPLFWWLFEKLSRKFCVTNK